MSLLNTTGYNHEFFHSLKDSNNMWGLAELHQDELHFLGGVICRHNMEEIVGVSLVHRHHDLHEDERFVWELSSNVWCAEPKRIAESNLVPINWGVGISENIPCLYSLEFCIMDDRHGSEFLASSNLLLNSDFIKDFTETVVDMGVENLFGLSLLQTRSHFNQMNTTVLEQSDLSRRITKAWVIPKNNLKNNSGGVTLWNFTKNHGINVVRDCTSGNSRHCCDNAIDLH